MKNIHLIPTDKPSRLYKTGNFLLLDSKAMPNNTLETMNQHIYITSDEEINQQTKPCWCINTIKNTWDADLIYYQGSMPQYHYKGFKKIILTTDQDLIKDGVQAIDDTFLEWFVKNPSCEEVKVELHEVSFVITDNIYKIIIPQEELTYTEAVKKEERIFNSIMMKQETLEEAAKKQWGNIHRTGVLGFIEGAKWQEKRRYSEEEVIEIIDKWVRYQEEIGDSKSIPLPQFIEQFKKKQHE
jgi:hypothetical protein